MDSFELNKIAGAVLFTGVVILGLSIVAEGMFHAPHPEQPGYEIAVAEDEGSEAAGEEEAGPDLGTLLATADASAGEAAIRPCTTCHTFEQGGENRVGPNLYGIVGAEKAHLDGFNYSSTMQERGDAGETWGYDELDQFIADPRGYINGTTMAFAGVRDPQARANILAYLASITDSPPPFPEPAAEEAEAPADDDTAEAGEAAGEDTADATEEAEAEQDTAAEDGDDALLQRIAAADPADGPSATRPCMACHTFEEGEADRVGPNLYNIVGGPKAHLEGFNYSSALQERGEAGETWGYEELDAFLEAPRDYIDGTTMAFAGVRDEDARATIIAYLASLSENPPPLPDGN